MRFERRDDERKRSICILDMSAAKVNKESAAQLRRIQKAEDLKELYAKINRVRNDRERTGVTRIEISKHPTMDPKSCTEWIQVDVPTEVLMHLQKRNQAHFGQAHGSPFTIPPLFRSSRILRWWLGKSMFPGWNIRQKIYDPNVQLLLQHLHQVHEMYISKSRLTMTGEEFASKLKIWTESTTTSPSGHLFYEPSGWGSHSRVSSYLWWIKYHAARALWLPPLVDKLRIGKRILIYTLANNRQYYIIQRSGYMSASPHTSDTFIWSRF